MHYTSKEVYEYISNQTKDPIIERKKCRISGQDFPIYQSDLEFYDKISPKFEVSADYAKKFLEEYNDIAQNFEYKDGKLKCKIPTPTLCPEERQRRRLAFRNERKLYRRKCDFVGNAIISIYNPDPKVSKESGKSYTVYNQDIWWSDKRDALDYGKDTPMDDTFFNTFDTLLHEVPQINFFGGYNENSEYVNCAGYNKNCYMCFDLGRCEDSYYSNIIYNSSDLMDCLGIWDSKHCYQCFNSSNLTNSYYCLDCDGCYDCYYCRDCTGCSHCIGCSNIVNKSYCIANISVGKEKFLSELQRIKKEGSFEYYSKALYSNKNIDSTSVLGSHNKHGKNLSFCSFTDKSSTSKFLLASVGVNNSYDDCFQGIEHSEYNLETLGSENMSYSKFAISCWAGCSNIMYCYFCHSSSNLFGCVGLRNKEYCIFNKQYTKEEYNQLVPKVIAQMMRKKQRGEFFDPQLSPFGYNETVAMEYYPLSKEEALKLGYKRSDYEAPFPKVEKFVQGKKLWTASCKTIHEQKPELLEKLLNYAVVCEVSGRPFRIIKQEIDFYIKHDLPLPRKHPDIRHQERMDKRPGRTLCLRNCDKCGEEMLSVYNTKQVIPAKAGIQETSKDSGSSQEGQRCVTQSLPDGQTGEAKSLKTDTMDSSAKASEGQKIYCSSCYQKEIYG